MTEAPWADAGSLATWQAGDPAQLIAAATSAVRRYCNWHIGPSRTDEIIVNGSGVRILNLPTLHLTAISDVTELRDPWPGAGDTPPDPVALVENVDYWWSDAGYLTKARGCLWTDLPRGVTATITHGYDEIPEEVVALVLGLVSRASATPRGEIRIQRGPFAEFYAHNPGDPPSGTVVPSRSEYDVLETYRIPMSGAP